jgi:P pilus assembly chaperone PapD
MLPARGTLERRAPALPRAPRGALALLALLALLLPGGVARAGSFQVAPTRFEFSLERRFTNFFTVSNNSGEPLRLRISTAFLEPDAKGELKPRPGSPYDLGPWMVINPRRVNLAPSEKRVVRFTVRPPAGLAPGEYRTVVFFEELPPRPEDVGQEGSGVRIQILTRLGVTVYGSIGKPAAELSFTGPSVSAGPEGVQFKATAGNAGNAHATLDILATLLGADGAEQGHAEERLVLQRGQQRPLVLAVPRPAPGAYRLRVQARAGDRIVYEGELPVRVGAGAR